MTNKTTNMKKSLLLCASALLLTACADKQQYEEAVLAEMKIEKDLKDYNIDPEHMTDCVVDLSSKNMPGSFPYDPARLTAYKNYATMLSMSSTEDKQNKLEELRSLFGSPKELAKAHSNYTESVMNCLASIIMESEGEDESDDKEKEIKG